MQATVKASPAPGRNEPCLCGSGRKYKQCCLRLQAAPLRALTLPVLPKISLQDPFEAHLQAGIAQLRGGDPLQALHRLSAATTLRPHSVEAISNFGVALNALGQLERAAVCYRQAIALQPGFAAAHSNLGQALSALGRPDEAAESLQTAVALNPSLTDPLINLGPVLRALCRFEESAEASRRALELRPGNPEALLNLGNALKDQGLLAEAAEAFRRTMRAAPKDPRAASNLAETLRDVCDIAGSATAYKQALAADPTNQPIYSNMLYLHAFARDISPAAELALARGWERAMLTHAERAEARRAAAAKSGVFPAVAPHEREDCRLRVGIVSAELGTHAVSEFLEPFLEHLDHSRFHLTLFPVSGRHCERAARIRAFADDFIPLTGLPDGVAVERVRGQRIDVLLDTSGHTAGNRLGIFARRAAPVQATWIGYWSTTGLTEMDYFIGDPDQPAAIEPHFSEGLWRLPRLGVCYRGDPGLAIDWQPDADGTLWLGSFNKFPKIREETIALWSTVLHAIPHAKLLLEDRCAREAESHERLRADFAAQDVDAARIQFIPYLAGHERHMLMYNRLDIALDTVPFNGGTTTFDALWMGVPVLTVQGEIMGARVSGAALTAMGRPEWIAPDANGFAALVQAVAGQLAGEAAAHNRQRRAQRAQMAASPLGDAVSLTRALESALTGMYERWLQTGTSPAQKPL